MSEAKCPGCQILLSVQAFYCAACNGWKPVIVHQGTSQSKVKLECSECRRTVVFLKCQLPTEMKVLARA